MTRVLVVSAVVVAVLLVLTGSAFADATGQVSGTVRGTDGAPLAGIWVSASAKSSGDGGDTLTDEAGNYTVAGLAAGAYTVTFRSVFGAKVGYFPRWYNGKDAEGSADPVVVSSGATTAGIDTTLLRVGTITGRVTDVPGNALSDVTVSVARVGSPIGVGGGVAAVDANGRYAVTGLATGDYRVQFSETGGPASVDPRNLVTLYYGQKSPSDPVDVVHLDAEATTTGIDAQLHDGGWIAGTVTDGSGNPLAGVGVFLFLGGANDYAYTDAAGRYTISKLEPGSYTVYFEPADGSDYLHQNFGGTPFPPSVFGGPPPSWTGHTPVTVTAGIRTGAIDVALQRGGVITGEVTDAQRHPLAGISVNLAPPGSGPVFPGTGGEVMTGADGRYRIDRLLAGTYRVSFAGHGFSGQLYGGAQTYDAATPVDVPAGGTVAGIDAQLQLGGSISGSVGDPEGHPVSAFVWAYRPDGTVASMSGSNDGGFTITDVAAGSYLVYATALGTPLSGFFTNTLDGAASLVTVVPGRTTPGIDIHVRRPAPTAPGAPGLTSSSPPGPASSPGLTAFHGTLAVSRSGTIVLSLRCAGPTGCAGTAALTVASATTAARRPSARPARTTIGHTRFLVPASVAAPVPLRLSSTGRSILHRNHGRIAAQLRITGPNGATMETVIARLRSIT